MMKQLDTTLSVFEKGLNYVGYVPFVSTISGALRAEYGKIEVIGGLAVTAFKAISALFQAGAQRDASLERAVEHLTYAWHGVANIFRGIIEAIPFASLVTCLPYDLSGCRYTYPLENAAVAPRAPRTQIA